MVLYALVRRLPMSRYLREKKSKIYFGQSNDSLFDLLIGRIAKQSPGYSLAILAPALSSLLLLPIFSHYITPAEFGTYALLQVVGVIFKVFSSLGIPAMAPFYYSEEREDDQRKKKLGNLLIWMTLINMGMLGVFALLGEPLFKIAIPSLNFYPFVVIVLFQSFFTPYLDVSIITWRMREKVSMVARMTVLTVITTALLQLMFVVKMGWGLLGLLVGSLLGAIVSAAILLFLIRSEVTFWLSMDELKKALRLGLPSIPNNLFSNIYRFSDRVILERFVTHELLGLYYLALRFGDLVRMGVDIFGQSWLPIFYKEAGQEEKKFDLVRAATISMAVFGAGALVVSFAAEIYIKYAMERSFYGAIYLVPFAVVAQLLKGSYVFPHLAIWFSKKTYYFLFITLVPMVMSIVLNISTIPILGVYGAAAVMVFCFFLHSLITYRVGQRVFPLPYSYGKIALIMVSAGVLVFVESPLLNHSGFFYRALSASMVYGTVGALIALGVLRSRVGA